MKRYLFSLAILLIIILPVCACADEPTDEQPIDVEAVTNKAEHWDTNAQYQLGEYYAEEAAKKPDRKSAMPYLQKSAFWAMVSDMWVMPPTPDLYAAGPRKAEKAVRALMTTDNTYDFIKAASQWRIDHLKELKEAFKNRYLGKSEKIMLSDYANAPISRWRVSKKLVDRQGSPCGRNTHSIRADGAVFWCSDSSDTITWIDANL